MTPVPLALFALALVALVALVWRVASTRRCTCQREEPLAGLGALAEVTETVRRAQRIASRPSPHRPRTRGAPPCP